ENQTLVPQRQRQRRLRAALQTIKGLGRHDGLGGLRLVLVLLRLRLGGQRAVRQRKPEVDHFRNQEAKHRYERGRRRRRRPRRWRRRGIVRRTLVVDENPGLPDRGRLRGGRAGGCGDG